MATAVSWLNGKGGKTARALWNGLVCGENGDAIDLDGFNDNTITVTGTFNSQTVTIQGSNDGTNWFTLTDHAGSNLAFTAAGMKLITEAPKSIRPSFSGSSGGDVDIIIELRKA